MSILAAQQRTSSVRLVVRWLGKNSLLSENRVKIKLGKEVAIRNCRPAHSWPCAMRHAPCNLHRVKICVFDGCAQFWLIGQGRRISLGLDWLEPMLAVRNF